MKQYNIQIGTAIKYPFQNSPKLFFAVAIDPCALKPCKMSVLAGLWGRWVLIQSKWFNDIERREGAKISIE